MAKDIENANELYRKERKERIAKNAKKNAKRSIGTADGRQKAGKVVKAVISVVLAAAIVFGCLYYFGIPQKTLKCVTVDGKSYSMAEFSYYYMNVYATYRSYSSQYGAQYSDGFDSSLPPDLQTRDDGNGGKQTFSDYFAHLAVENMASVKRYYNKALAEGIELTEEDNAAIEEAVSQFDANLGNYSLSSYLALQFGKGVTASVFKRIITEQQYGTRLQETVSDKYEAEITEETVKNVYNENKSDYDVVDFRWYTIDIDTESSDAAKAKEEAEKSADKFMEAVTEGGNTVDAFKKQALAFLDSEAEDYDDNVETYGKDAATVLYKVESSTIKSQLGDDAFNWLYNTADGKYTVKAGEMKRFTTDSAVYIIYALGTPYISDVHPTDVRHILFAFPESADGSEVSEADKKATLEKANAVLDKYNESLKNGDESNSENLFMALVGENSDDTGTKENGGLIEDMTNNNQYVANFEDWAFAEGKYAGEKRAHGDVAVVETEYGYHIMYYVGADEKAEWYQTISDSLLSEKTGAYWEEFEAQFADSEAATGEAVTGEVSFEDEHPGVSVNKSLLNSAVKKADKLIKSNWLGM